MHRTTVFAKVDISIGLLRTAVCSSYRASRRKKVGRVIIEERDERN